jgi:phage FluMu protein Com
MASGSEPSPLGGERPVQSLTFKDVRCMRCGRLLLRWEMNGSSHVEVKCPRCQQMNLVKLEHKRSW